MVCKLLAAACAAAVVLCAPACRAADYTIDGSRLTISGSLYGDREFDDFTSKVRKNPEIKTIVMKNFYGGIRMSNFLSFPKFIRDNGLATEVDGPCISACAMAFLGGVRRGVAPGANPKRTFVGFHGVYRAGRRSELFETTYVNALRRYTAGKMTMTLALQAYRLPQAGYMAFYDSRQLKRDDGTSVFLCTGKEKRQTSDCVGLKKVDGYTAGVFTH